MKDALAWRLAASADIHDLYGRWSHCLDRGAPELAVDDFAEDGVLWASDRGSYEGRSEIAAICAHRAGATMHVIDSVAIETVEAATARAHAYFHLVDLASGAIVAWGCYDDDLVHDSGRWRWSVKAVEFLWRAEAYQGKVADLAMTNAGTPNPVGGFRT